MAYYDDIGSLIAAAEAKVTTILRSDVSPIAEQIVREHIESDIYGAYSPKPGGWFGGKMYTEPYRRRHDLASQVYTIHQGNDEILVTSYATGNIPVLSGYSWARGEPGSFLQFIEQGGFGLWQDGFPRPAIKNAQAEIDASLSGGAIASAIQGGIKREFN